VIQLAIPSRAFVLDDLAWSLAGVLVFGLAATGIEQIGHIILIIITGGEHIFHWR
jgi:hypothetical protein